jgi:UDP-N-acetylmuramate--alanine ligase
VLERGGLDPDVVIGGRLKAFGSNARLGRGEYMVAEADESDRSFLMLWPSVAVMTNIDHEHMESYGSFAELQQAFADFGNNVPFYGSVVACADDAPLTAIVPDIKRRVITYGLETPTATIAGSEIELGSFGGRCVVHEHRTGGVNKLGVLELSIPGRHNLQNALAAVAVAGEVGLTFDQAADALRGFEGAERRFERLGDAAGVLVVDDYAHHPTEIAAVLAAARATLGRRLVVVFQPHRYTRTRSLMEAFGPSLKEADEIILTDIYAASEDPIPGITIETLADAVRRGSTRPVHLVKPLDAGVPHVLTIARPGDAVIMLGAGSIGTLPTKLLDALRQKEAGR